MSLILTTLSDNTISVLNTLTNVRVSYTATRCKWSVHLSPPVVTYVYYDDQLICACSDDPYQYPGSSILGATDGTTAAAALTTQPLITATSTGGSSGTAAVVDITPASIAQITPGTGADLPGSNSVIGQLKKLVQLGQDDRDFSEIILTETTGLKRTVVRQTVYNEETGLFSTSFINVDGTALVPAVVLPVVPAVAADDIEIVSFSYHALAAGTGYSVNHLLEQVRLINTATSSIISTIWFNRTTGLVLATAPNVVTLKPDVHQLEDIAQSTLSVSGYQKIRLYYISNVNDPGNGTSIGDLIEAQDTYRGDVLDSTVYTNLSTGLTIPVGGAIPDWLPIDYENYLAVKNNNNLLTAATNPLTAPYVNIADSFTGQSASVVPGGTAVDNTHNQLAIGISPDSNKVKLTDGAQSVVFSTTNPTGAVYGIPVRLPVDANGNQISFGYTAGTAPFVKLTDLGGNLLNFTTVNPGVGSFGLPARLPVDADGNTVVVGNTIATAPWMKITDGTDTINIVNAVPTDTAFGLPVRLIPDFRGHTVNFGSTNATAPFIKLSDGNNPISFTAAAPSASAFGIPTRSIPNAVGNTEIIASTIGTALFSRITNGTIEPVITAATVAPVAADPALVVSLSPNSSPVKGTYNDTLPVLNNGESASLQVGRNGRLLVSNLQATTQFGTTSPQPDIALVPGKRIYRITITNNTGTVFFLQLHNSVGVLAPGFVPINGHIYRIPGNTTVILDQTLWSADGEIVSPNTRIGFSSTFVNYTAVPGAVLTNVALNYKVEA